MGSLGFDELLIVIVVAIIIFGKDLPSVARKVGGWYSKLKRQINEVKDEIRRQIPEEDLDVRLPDAPPPKDAPSAALPGPDPADPEYKPPKEEAGSPEPKPFDPARGGPSFADSSNASTCGKTTEGEPAPDQRVESAKPAGGNGSAVPSPQPADAEPNPPVATPPPGT